MDHLLSKEKEQTKNTNLVHLKKFLFSFER